jgi:hypothetical protein
MIGFLTVTGQAMELSATLAMPLRNRITIQMQQANQPMLLEPLIAMLIFQSKKDYQCILLTKSDNVQKPIRVLLM